MGTYEVSPAFHVVISIEGDELVALPTGWPKVELLAKKDGLFFFKVADGEIQDPTKARAACVVGGFGASRLTAGEGRRK